MTVLWAESALLPEGFADGVRLEVDARGDLDADVLRPAGGQARFRGEEDGHGPPLPQPSPQV